MSASQNPTAASATIGGRVTTVNGQGIRNVPISLLDTTANETRNVLSNAFGYLSIH